MTIKKLSSEELLSLDKFSVGESNPHIFVDKAICGLTHRQSYKDIFTLTCIKTSAVFVVIGLFYLTHLV